MDYMAKAMAAVDAKDCSLTCMLHQKPPDVGRIRIDHVYFPYKLTKWDSKRKIATLNVNTTPDELAFKKAPALIYLTDIIVVGKFKK